jgi:L-threonylcarbamoyladenylate synthase
MIQIKKLDGEVERIIRTGGIGIMPTDTIYGMVGSALRPKTVQKIYKLRRRGAKKPFIVLISSLKDLSYFNIKIDNQIKKILNRVWPGKVSVILPCGLKKFSYLHRGTKTLAFRLPKNKFLIKLIKKTGPLVAPSANPEGLRPAETVARAKKYFGDKIDFYKDGGKLSGRPSTLIKIKGEEIIILRQ